MNDDLMAFIMEEAQHRVINNECTKIAESALAACTKKAKKFKEKGRNKPRHMSHAKTAMESDTPNQTVSQREVARKDKA